MTVPTNIQLPIFKESMDLEDPTQLSGYFRDLTLAIQRMYEDLAQGINGDIRSEALDQSQQWIPTLDGAVTGAFTYTHQTGWVFRQGIFVDVWFDIAWSASAATGNLILNLPYKVARSEQKPFVGVVQSSVLTYTAGTGIVINAIQNSFTADFWNVGDGFTTANQDVTATGHIIGHIRYIGKQDETEDL